MPIPTKQHVKPPFPDYYPFGSMMPGRNGGNDYEYGFNGMRSDDALKGNNNSFDFGARMYDPRLGRWMSTDAYEGKQPGWSPYKFGFNSPLNYFDPDGNSEVKITVNRIYNDGVIAISIITVEVISDHLENKTTTFLGIESAEYLSLTKGGSTYPAYFTYSNEPEEIIKNLKDKDPDSKSIRDRMKKFIGVSKDPLLPDKYKGANQSGMARNGITIYIDGYKGSRDGGGVTFHLGSAGTVMKGCIGLGKEVVKIDDDLYGKYGFNLKTYEEAMYDFLDEVLKVYEADRKVNEFTTTSVSFEDVSFLFNMNVLGSYSNLEMVGSSLHIDKVDPIPAQKLDALKY